MSAYTAEQLVDVARLLGWERLSRNPTSWLLARNGKGPHRDLALCSMSDGDLLLAILNRCAELDRAGHIIDHIAFEYRHSKHDKPDFAEAAILAALKLPEAQP